MCLEGPTRALLVFFDVDLVSCVGRRADDIYVTLPRGNPFY